MTLVITHQNLRLEVGLWFTVVRWCADHVVFPSVSFSPMHLGAYSGRIRCSFDFGAWRRSSLAFSSGDAFLHHCGSVIFYSHRPLGGRFSLFFSFCYFVSVAIASLELEFFVYGSVPSCHRGIEWLHLRSIQGKRRRFRSKSIAY